MYNLTQNQKDALIWIVGQVRSEDLPEEFEISWGENEKGENVAAFYHSGPKSGHHVSGLNPGMIDALAANELLHVKEKKHTRSVTLTGKAYEAVDSNFDSFNSPDETAQGSNAAAPLPIRESLRRFHLDFPADQTVCFIMMQFGETKAHKSIHSAIEKGLRPFGISAVRADEKEYHEDLYYNILTYIYGCAFGVAVFERIEEDEFNPNVSLEVGYMLALGKPVCLLKDSTLKTLTTDLIGKLYRTFDPQAAAKTIPPELERWCRDMGFSTSHT